MNTWYWFVYIIRCKDGLYYTGLTWNLEKRMEQHRLGKGSKFTSKHWFDKLLYFERFNDVFEARTRERQIKGWSRKKKELLIEGKIF